MAKGLSQSELGGERYSGSYISHIESGRRHVSAEVMDFLATRLGVSPAEIDGTQLAQQADLEIARSMVSMYRSAENHDWRAASQSARAAAEAALRVGRQDRWWEAVHQEATLMLTTGDYDRSITLAAELVDHPVSDLSPLLKCQALIVLSRALRAQGRLADAIAQAELAVDLGDMAGPDDVDPVIEALMTYISACAEAGRIEPATRASQRLESLRGRATGHVAGMVAWTLGNLAFLVGDEDRGIREHDLAVALLRPEANLRLLARLHKALAHYRLQAGQIDRAREHLDTAQPGLRLVGNPSDLVELHLVEAELAIAEGRDGNARALVEHCLEEPAIGTAPHLAGEANLLLADLDARDGHSEHARARYRQAAHHFEDAQALDKAVVAWRRYAELA